MATGEGGEGVSDSRGEAGSGVVPCTGGEGVEEGAMMWSGEKRGKVASLKSLRMFAAFACSDWSIVHSRSTIISRSLSAATLLD